MLLLTLGALAADPQPALCCDTPVVAEQLKYYLKFHAALAAGDTGKASGELYGWSPRAKKAVATLSGDERAAQQRIADTVEKLKNARLSALQTGLEGISRDLTYLVLRHPGGSVEVSEAHCGERVWLQRPGELMAPYADCEPRWRQPVK